MSLDTRPVVCHVIHTLNVGGAEILAREFAVQSASQFRSVFACLDEIGELGDQLRDEGFLVENLNRKNGLDMRLPRRLAAFFKRHDVSVIHAHQYTPFFYSSLSRFPWKRLPPVLFTEHGRLYPDVRKSKHVIANKFLLGDNDAVVAVGQHVKQALVDNEGLPAERVRVIYNGIDVDHFRATPDGKPQLRQKLGLPDGFLIVQVARLNPLKDHATAIRTLHRIMKSEKEVHLVIVGDGTERQSIEQLIMQHDLTSRVHLVGLRHNVQHYLQASDAFLLTSLSEGIPLTLIEAMASGLPCIATNVGGVGEVIQHGQCGLLADAGDDASLATHLVRLKNEPMLYEQFVLAGRDRAKNHFSNLQMHTEYQTLYQTLAGRK